MTTVPRTKLGLVPVDPTWSHVRPYDDGSGEGQAQIIGASLSVDLHLSGSPAAWRRLAKAIEDAAMEAERQIADNLATPMGQERERARPCGRCGTDTWNIDGDCDDCLDSNEAAAADLPGLAS